MNEKELIARIRLPEWSDVEFKEARTALPKNIWQTVSAFANTDGGYIILGIQETAKDHYEPVGVEAVDKIQNDFVTTLRGEKFNIQLSSRGDLIDLDGKHILVFKISPMPRQAKPVYFNNDIRNTYLRMGSTDQRCGKEEIERMLREASEQTSDSLVLPDYDAAHTDRDTLAGYRRYLELRAPSHHFLKLDDIEFLVKIGALKENRLTVAGLLLFGKEESIFSRFPAFELSIYRMPENPDSETRWLDRKIYNLNIIETYLEGLAYLKQFIPMPFMMADDGVTRLEMVPSYITIREALANLLMHRDYFDTGIPAVRIYQDRIVFRNPGASLLSMNEMLYEAETVPRNPVIARAFRLLGWAETAGSGILKMQKNWQEAGFPPPVIRNNQPRYWFTLELEMKKPAAAGDGLGEKIGETTQKTTQKTAQKTTQIQKQILDYLRENPEAGRKELAQHIPQITEDGIKYNLTALKAMGLLSRIGPARGGRWMVNEDK
jgi:ATP-dependent DNA helicase RecG